MSKVDSFIKTRVFNMFCQEKGMSQYTKQTTKLSDIHVNSGHSLYTLPTLPLLFEPSIQLHENICMYAKGMH